MVTVFGRSHATHSYDDALAGWLKSTIEYRAVARNLMHDHRVSENRELALDQFVTKPCTESSLQNALVKYKKAKVQDRNLPHYVYAHVNENNLMVRYDSILPLLNKDVELMRVLDLNGLGHLFQWAKRRREWRTALKFFPGPFNEKNLDQWLTLYLQSGSIKKIRQFVNMALDVLNSYSDEFPYQPTWAAFWDEFKECISDGVNRWGQVLGIPKPVDRWLIVLKYRVREAGTIARPTQLDAGWSAFHFPSPPNVPLFLGGFAMDLGEHDDDRQLISEIVHKQIHHSIGHWTDSGALLGRTTVVHSRRLDELRQKHHELLRQVWGIEIVNWMPQFI